MLYLVVANDPPKKMNRETRLNINVNDVSETAFLTLQCHALDARSKRPLLNDQSSVGTLELLKKQYAESDRLLHKKLFGNRVRDSLVTHTALRAKKYDRYVVDFLERHPDAAIINIGCGLDHRFERVDNGKVMFFDLDLPDIMDIKSQIFPESDRYRQFSQSVFEFDWMDEIPRKKAMFLAEGVFMYCSEMEVKSLFLTLQEKFPGSEMVCEVFNSKWLKGWRGKMMKFKLKKELKLGEGSTFRFGLPDSNEIEGWKQGFTLLDDWSYLDSEELDSAVLKLMGKSSSLRKIQWTIHYRLDQGQ